MKKTHIILIIVLAFVTGIIIATYSDTSTSVGFDEAFANPGQEYKVSGVLDKSKEVIYDPQIDAELCTFYVTDGDGVTKKVYYRSDKDPKPMGLEQSESIDMYGVVEDGEFHAKQVLMKCPSKYNENKHIVDESSEYQNN